jgi:hypothetical protein
MGDGTDPNNSAECLIGAVIIVIGVITNATLFASISSYAASMSAAQTAHNFRQQEINKSLKYLNLEQSLADRISLYYDHCWACHQDFAAQRLMDDLPSVFKRRASLQARTPSTPRAAPATPYFWFLTLL